MIVLFVGVGLFIVALLIHIALWRIHVPRQQAGTLIAVILIVGFLGSGPLFASWPDGIGLSGEKLLLAVGVFGSLAAIYLILFSAIEADSPTLTILNVIHASGSQGISEDKLQLAMSQYSYVQLRFNQLLQDGMVIETPHGLQLQSRGRLLSSFVLFYRRLLHRNYAGG